MTHASRTLSLARIISQGLVEETAADNPIAAVDNMLALQAQLLVQSTCLFVIRRGCPLQSRLKDEEEWTALIN